MSIVLCKCVGCVVVVRICSCVNRSAMLNGVVQSLRMLFAPYANLSALVNVHYGVCKLQFHVVDMNGVCAWFVLNGTMFILICNVR